MLWCHALVHDWTGACIHAYFPFGHTLPKLIHIFGLFLPYDCRIADVIVREDPP